MSIKLNLGCGRQSPKFFTDYVNVDLIKHEGVDIEADVTRLPFVGNYADEIFASHILEHFGTIQIPVVLKEWMRVLKHGGQIKIAVPNIINAFKIAEEYCHKNGYDGEYLCRVLHGGQKGETMKESISNAHRTAFDKKMLIKNAEIADIEIIECYYGNCSDKQARHPSTWVKTDETGFNVFLIGRKK